jgi:uncharacterized protein
MDPSPGPLSPEEGAQALKLVRKSLETWLMERRRTRPIRAPEGGLAQRLGAFVTVRNRHGELRGCIGHMTSNEPLADLLPELAVSAGTGDPRFPPVSARELPELLYEVSVLSSMKLTAADDVQPGVHGIYIRQGRHTGVLLPQVAQEWGWSREEFLGHTCRKAGLPENAWRESDTEILTFTAQVFEESTR